MYYLLEDNRIIDSENLPYEWKYHLVLISEKDKTIVLQCRDPRERQKYKIKKQSENVWDLIENGDLLKIKQPKESEEKYNFGEYKEPETTNYASYIKEAFPNKILAIYKPNSKGDYIKVWEKKKYGDGFDGKDN